MKRFLGSLAVLSVPVFVACVSDGEVGTNSGNGSTGGTGGVGGSAGVSSDGGAGESGSAGASGSGSGSGTGGGGGGGGSGDCLLPSDTTVLAKLAHATCAAAEPCCQTAGMTFDVAQCEQLVIGEYRPEFDAARCKGLDYDEPGIAECIAMLDTYGKLCGAVDIDVATAVAWDAACSRIFKGPENSGAACISSLECLAGPGKKAKCDKFGSDPGTCVVTTLLPDGASVNCGSSGYGVDVECESLYCAGDHCEATSTLPLGSTCDIFGSCEPGTHCDGTCKLDLDAGSSCDEDADCKAGLECLSTNLCGGAIGSACTEPEPGKPTDCALGKCVGGKCGYHPLLMASVAYGYSLYAAVACKP